MRRTLVPLLFGLIGAGILIGLGQWQVERLAWKEGILAQIEDRISAAPMPLVPAAAAIPDKDRYQPVALNGSIEQSTLRVLVSVKRVGAGYRLISPFLLNDGRRVLLDRGFVPVETADIAPPQGLVEITGNLHWPDDRTSSTPENDVAGNTWFARDIDQMSAVLETETLLVIAREMSPPDPKVTPLPVDTSGIPNDHLQYAITWFSLAAIWIIMTGAFLWRARKQEG